MMDTVFFASNSMKYKNGVDLIYVDGALQG